LADLAALLLRAVGLPPAEERGERDGGGERPGESDHDIGDAAAGEQRVLQVAGDGPVAVQGDGGHVPDAGRAAQHVEADPDEAQLPAQPPPPPGRQLLHQAQRHHQGRH